MNATGHAPVSDLSSSAAPHPSLLVIGYGNPLRVDDGVGWQVGQQLAHELSSDDISVIVVHQLTPELAEPIGRARLVIFVDACEGDAPGQVTCQVIEPAVETALTFSHDVNPPVLLAMALALYGACPTAVLVSVAGHDFGYGVGLSHVVHAALPEVVRRVRAILVDGVDPLDGPTLKRAVEGRSDLETGASIARPLRG